MRKPVRRWITARRSDPVPVLLTAAGCVVSVLAVIVGAYADWRGVASDVMGNLIILGPALFLSNIVVKRIQDARARARIAPLLHVVAQLLHWAVASAKQALDLLNAEVRLDMPPEGEEHITLADAESAVADAAAQLDAATEGQRLPATFVITEPLSFPRFGAIRRLVEQADRSHPMPWSIAAADIAVDWAERCGVDFEYTGPDGIAAPRRHVGLSQIEDQSKDTAATTRVGAESYLQAVRGSLYCALRIADRLANETPPGLLQEPSR